MVTPKKFSIGDLLAVLGALVLTGIGWAVGHPETTIAVVAIVLIWVINFLFTWKGIQLHKSWLTGILFVVAFLLTWLFQPALFPPWPSVVTTDAIVIWLGSLISFAGPIVAYTTGLYNLILAKVLEKLLYQPQLQ